MAIVSQAVAQSMEQGGELPIMQPRFPYPVKAALQPELASGTSVACTRTLRACSTKSPSAVPAIPLCSGVLALPSLLRVGFCIGGPSDAGTR